MAARLKLVSHKLCPLCAARGDALTEKGVAFERIGYRSWQQARLVPGDFSARQDPVLGVGDPRFRVGRYSRIPGINALKRCIRPCFSARRTSCVIEYGSAVLADIAAFTRRLTRQRSQPKRRNSSGAFAALEARVAASPWFDGEKFSRSTRFRPAFRYFYVFRPIADSDSSEKPKSSAAQELARRRRCAPRSVRSIRRCCAISSTGGILGLSKLQARAAA